MSSKNDQKGLKIVKEIETSAGIRCAAFGVTTQSCLVTGGFDGKVQIRDIEHAGCEATTQWNAHKSLVTTIDTAADAGRPEIVSGSDNGYVNVWDVRQKDRPALEMMPVINGPTQNCWSVAFGGCCGQEDRYVCAGFSGGDVKIFDLRCGSVYWEDKLESGVCCVQFDRKDIRLNKLATAGLDSSISIFDMLPINPSNVKSVKTKAHDSTIWAIRHLPQNREVFASCGGGGSIILWQ